DVLFVQVVCSDRERHQRQVEQRESDLADWEVPDWPAVVDRDYEPWQGERLVIDTAQDDSESHLASIERRLSARAAAG
ncbi:MAG: adenylyl-sulfate kinase, partial [Actinomycetota bacterium]|nr:adenylyl-sulfate kinase [Actinomycetota bacterium]